MRYKVGKSREQIEMMFCLEEMVPKNSAARQIDEFVDNANTEYFTKSTPKNTGSPAYNPKDMLKLYIYGMENGIVSSRKLEREARRNIELMWLLNKLTPESKTICNFRKENKHNLVRFFKEFCLTLVKTGDIDGKVMAIDGTKIRANNSRRKNFSAKKLDNHIENIDEKITTYLKDLDKTDKIEELMERKAKYEEYRTEIETTENTEVSTVDPDARLMSVANGGVEVSYNVQSVVDGKNKLIAGMEVTNCAADQGQLGKVMPKVKEELRLEEVTVLADKGYYKTEDFKICEDNNITTIVATSDKREQDVFDADEFTYDPENDVYICPNYRELFPGQMNAKGFREYKNNRACRDCQLKELCTKGTRRVISRHVNKSSAERNDKRYLENKELYKQRQMLVEHLFGTIKRTMGIRQFMTRGKESVAAEVALIFLCYNLKRLRVIHRNHLENDPNSLYLSKILLCLFILLNPT